MNTANCETTVRIPAAIDALPLAINEKITLALILENPRCKNADLAKRVGMTERGLKKLLQRLISAGYLKHTGKGRARRLLLAFDVESGTQFPEPENQSKIPNRELSSQVQPAGVTAHPATKTLPLNEEFEQTMRAIDEMTREGEFFPETAVRQFQPLIERIETEMTDSPQKQKILEDLKSRQGAFMAIALGAGLPKEARRHLDKLISNAKLEQLVRFRERAVTGNLVGGFPPLLAEFTEPDSHEPS